VTERRPLALIGFMGSGKSAVGALVAEREGAPFRDLDRLIEAKAGMSVPAIFATRGEAAFRALEKELLPEVIQPGVVAALGGGAVVDDESWQLVAAKALSVYLEVPFDRLWARLQGAPGRPLMDGRARDEVETLFGARRPRYEQAERRVDGNRPAELVAEEVRQLWSA